MKFSDSLLKWEEGTDLIVFCEGLSLREKDIIYCKWWCQTGSRPCAFCEKFTDGRGSVGTTCCGCPLRDPEFKCHPSWDKIQLASNESVSIFVRTFELHAPRILEAIHASGLV